MADSPPSNAYRIEPLKGVENWLSWQVQMQDILTDVALLDYVLGKVKKPTEAEASAKWEKNDRKALTAIRLRVSSAVITHILSSKTAKDAWDTLKTIYNNTGVLAKVLARRKFLRHEMGEGGDMEEEIRKMRGLKEEMTLLGIEVEDREFSFTILTALPPSWDQFISAVGTNVPDSADLIGRIVQESSRRRERNTETALVAKSGKKKPKFRKGVFCHGCGKEGHIRPECKDNDQHEHGSGCSGKSSGKKKSRANVATNGNDSSDDYVFLTIDTPVITPEIAALVAKGETWLADTACQRHVVRDRSLFITYSATPSELSGVGRSTAIGCGDVRVHFVVDGKRCSVVLKDALHALSMDYNLISLGRLTDSPVTYKGAGDYIYFLDGDRTFAKGRKIQHLYHMAVKRPTVQTLVAHTSPRSWYDWHCALGHINTAQLEEMYKKKLVDEMVVDEASSKDFECEACIQAKHTRASFPDHIDQRNLSVGDLVFSDIWGPSRVESLQHNKYMITFTDAASRNGATYFMKTRDAALERYKHYEKLVETQLGKRIKTLHVDNAKEYTEGAFKAYLDSRGTICRTTAPYSPAQNGIAERMNRTLVERARAMLFAHSSPKFLWQEAIAYATYLRNRVPTRAINGMTPYEAFWGKRPSVRDA